MKKFNLNAIVRINYIDFLNSIWLTFLSSIVEIIFLYMIYLLISATLSEKKYIIIESFSINEKIIYSDFILITIITCAVNYGLKAYSIFKINLNNAKISINVGDRIFKSFLYNDYSSVKFTNKSELLNNLTHKIDVLSGHYLTPLITNLSNIMLIVLYGLLLSMINLQVSAAIGIAVVILYSIFIKMGKSKASSIGYTASILSEQALDYLWLTINTIKEIFIESRKQEVERNYLKIEGNYRLSRARIITSSLLPRYLLEFMVFAFLIVFTYFHDKSVLSIDLTFLALVLLIVQRGLPLLSAIISNKNLIYSSANIIAELNSILESSQSSILSYKDIKYESLHEKQINLIQFTNVSFSYKSKSIFNNFDLTINTGDKLAIVGSSGSGKSTLIELLLNLIHPDTGYIMVNKQELIKLDTHSYWSKITYLSQHIYMPNIKVTEYIVGDNLYDHEKLQTVIKICCLDDVFPSESDLINAVLLENGSNFSGGQKQRLHLAKSIYSDKEIIILDESTNAIDHENEIKIYKHLLSSHKTLITVTHNPVIYSMFPRIVDLSQQLKKGHVHATQE